jgi:Uma2 family endonuclease
MRIEGRRDMVSTKLVTAQELAAMGSDAPYELIEGELHEVSPSWIKSSIVASRISWRLAAFVEDRSLGFVSGEEGGFQLRRNPDTVIAPDLAFVREERIPNNYDFDSYFPGAPDLAVEVVSFSDTPADVMRKLALYASAEVPLVWVVYPARKAVTIHTLGEPPRTIGEQDILDGGDVLPGFELSVAEIFKLRSRR